MRVDDWRDQAACIGTPIWWWYAPEGENDENVIPEAVAMCAACPVRVDCLQHALVMEDNGLWAGHTPSELGRRRRRAGIRLRRFNVDSIPTMAGVPEAPPPTAFPDPNDSTRNDELWIERASRRSASTAACPPPFGLGPMTNGAAARAAAATNRARKTIEETDDRH